ncbi:MAG: PEP-CTERM sorting domain-containing protein [Methylotenera sp.]|nr:PEP-CTERM sorting domain-containing protein [Methylotenera sp.]HPH07125.1 PEP-CTERM sorting domain-containing protein [Methylotenera sp.]HPM49060.1 PEP-CTERM sorting domain-containing protein [Methylotenera sp.]HQM87072.1 PEP-CTERM sorting domain-containing protein [Methylotenera sp.]
MHGQFTSNVPEPETYTLTGIGLGLIGFHLRRRQKSNAFWA